MKRLVPQEYAERLSAVDDQPAGERRLVTILFSDVKGSTAMAEELDPEDVLEIMNGAFEILIPPIYKYEGTLARLMGDAILAFFGAPLAHENDPERAVRAALEIVEGAKAYADRLEAERSLQGFNVRVGINTGLVVVGEVGADMRVEYTAMGDAINLAARMEQNAPPGGILITHNTYQHVQGLFDVQAQAPLTVKGKKEPVATYLVQGARPRTFHVERHGVAGIETRMVGREAELKQLKEAFQLAMMDSERQVVTVVGEAGVGKSRLLDEFDTWLRERPQDIYYFKGRADTDLQAVPYALLRDVFNLRFGILESDSSAVVRDKVERGFAPLVTGTDDTERVHILGQLLGYDFNDSPHVQDLGGDAQQLRDRGLIYLADYFRAMTKDGPAVLLLEDLHWADDSSLDALNRLALALPQARLLILCVARPGLYKRRPHWGEGQPFHTRFTLQPLSRLTTRRLVDEILQKVDEVPPALRETVIGGAEGNPLYVEELIKTLIEEGVIVTGDERWQVDLSRLVEVEVPPTLTAVLQARLDRLPAEERKTLQWAAVIGRTFWDRAVAHLASDSEGRAVGDVAALLTGLRGRELVYQRETTAFSEAQEFIFKHAALRDVAYEGILRKMRRVYHALAAEWLIQQDEVGSLGLIAGHLERAGENERALVYLQRAGEQEAKRYANAEALDYYSRALALLPEGDPARYDLLLARESLYKLRGMSTEQARDLEELEALVSGLDEPLKEAQVLVRRSSYLQNRGEPALAIARGQEALESLDKVAERDIETLSLEAEALYLYGTVRMELGRYEEALERLEQVSTMAQRAENANLATRALLTLSQIHEERGEHTRAQACLDQAQRLSREAGNRRSEADVVNQLGVLHDNRGEYMAARRYFEESLRLSREIGDRFKEMMALGNLAYGAQLMGAYAQARSYYEEVLNIAAEMNRREPAILLNLSLISIPLGLEQEAYTYARQALALCQQEGRRPYEAYAWTNLGHALLERARPEASADAYRKALQIRETLELPSLIAESRAGLARAHLAQDEPQQALAQVIKILPCLEKDKQLKGAEEPFWIYLTCYRVLDAAKDPRANEVLAAGHTLLQERAARISDDTLRRSFLEKVPWHRDLEAAWAAEMQ
ncbi:MAG: ATP-binding protein [Anaerolineae bacterium]